MKIVSVLLAIPYILFCNTSVAQGNEFRSGYYINQNNDTVHGFISLNANNSTRPFSIRTNNDDKSSVGISCMECKLLSIGSESYICWTGARNMEYVEKFDFSIKNMDSLAKGTVLLQLLHKGSRLSLYHYKDVKDHFFLADGSSVQELIIKYSYITDWEKKKYVLNPPTYIVNPIWRNQLIAAMNNQLTKKQMYMMENSEFDKRSLIRLFRALDKSQK